MSRKKIIFIALGLLAIIAFFVILHAPRQTAPNGDGKEPERNGPSIIKLEGDAKLNSLLEAPQFFAAKSELSNYIYATFGSGTTSATIESTNLQDGGSIAIKIKVDGTRTVEATINSTATQFIFDVPAAKYETITPQSVVLNKYYGI